MENTLNDSFANGTEVELQAAIALYGHALLRYCHNIICDYHEAEDIVSMTFVKAYERRHQFQCGSSLSAWLYKIAYHLCMDHLRKRKLLFFMQPPEKASSSFMSDDLKEALLTLSVMERALIFNRIIEERDYKELEEIYQIPASTLRKRYERARKKLSKELSDYLELSHGRMVANDL